jgi:alpha-glucoside transport system substrate-binding protein
MDLGHRQPARRWWLLGLSFALLFSVTACGSSEPQPGDTVRVLGEWEDEELTAFLNMVAPFEERTGIDVLYTGTRDLRAVLADAIERGNPPDVAGLAGLGHMQELARAGTLRDLDTSLDLQSYKENVAPTFIELGRVDNRLVGLFVKATVKGLIWYNPNVVQRGTPRTMDELRLIAAQMTVTGGTKAWCVGLESRASSGWPGTDWIESFMLHRSGPDVYDQWVAGTLPWTSPDVRRAFELYGQIVAEDAVAGGVAGAIGTNFADAGEPLFDDPPGCLFLHQGSFMPTFFEAAGHEPRLDFDFFPFPEIAPEHHNTAIGAGDLFGLFTDNGAARELLEYLVSTEAQQRLVEGGGALSVNKLVEDYPNELVAREAALLAGAVHFRFDASDLMPAEVNEAFWQAVLDFTADQSELDRILERLDEVREGAYG